MTTPNVTEITQALDSVGRDTFLDRPDDPATVADLRSRVTILRPSPQRAAIDSAGFMVRARAA